jgi:uncharacterized protein (TIGR02118 family)
MVRRKPGIDRAEFREYYERVHAPLAASLMQRCKRYVRNFVEDEPAGGMDFDVITEFWFEGEGNWADLRGQFANAETSAILAEDEARFMDRSSMRIVVVRESETEPAILLGNQ